MSVPISIFNTVSATDAGAPSRVGTDVSGTGSYYSKVWSMNDAASYSLTVYFDGTMVGAFQLWTTDKPNPDETSDGDWVIDSTFTPSDPSGAPDSFQINGTNKAYRQRLRYTNSSGTGNIQAFVTVQRYR